MAMHTKLNQIYAAIDAYQFGRAVKLASALPDSNVLGKALLAHSYTHSGQKDKALVTLHKILIGDGPTASSLSTVFFEIESRLERQNAGLDPSASAASSSAHGPKSDPTPSTRKGKKGKKKPAPQQQQQQQHRRQKKGASAERIDPGTLQGYIVDLPGYGYGRAPTNITEDWQKDTQELLLHRRHEAGVLQRLFLLMDARRGMEGPNEHDRIVMRWLEDAEIPFTIVLTKADRVSVPLVVKQVNDFCLRYASQQQHQSVVAQSPVIHVTSSARGWGIHELMLSIETEFLGGNDEEENDAETDFL
mmetsp:Transcript_6573/g.18868  ORF Transcript_6573/g.18868 Transcript_6573/m.18868 type:complete len:304 (+) Transcript_6573:221-1132(+)